VATNKLAPLPTKPVGELDAAEVRTVLRRAATGEKEAVALTGKILDATPALAMELGDLERNAEKALLAAMTAKDDELARDVFARRLALMRNDLAGASPTPLERLLVNRVVMCWLQLQHADSTVAKAETQNITLTQGAYHRDRQDRAHKRYLSAIKTLAQVRRLQLPALQVNIAQQQVVANGTAVGREGDA
jgi:hypothetical protein